MVPVCIDFKISWVPNAALWIFMGAIAPMAPTLTHPLSCESFLKKLHNQFHSNKGVERKRGKEKKKNCSQNSAMRGMLNLCTNLVQIWGLRPLPNMMRTLCCLSSGTGLHARRYRQHSPMYWVAYKINFQSFIAMKYGIWSKFEVWDCCRTWCIRIGSSLDHNPTPSEIILKAIFHAVFM